MNIVAQYPNFTPLNLNVQIESAQRDSALREVIPSLAKSDVSANQYDQTKTKDQTKNYNYPDTDTVSDTEEESPIYEFSKITQRNNTDEHENDSSKGNSRKANGETLSDSEQKKVDQLKDRDEEVRTHEKQHQSAGGKYASAPKYDTERGPDGKSYVVNGEVNISTSEESTPERTVEKMQQVQRAALAPAEPSGQDRTVAAEAKQKEMKARAEIAKENHGSSIVVGDESQSQQKSSEINIKKGLSSRFSQVISAKYNNSWVANNATVNFFA